MNKKLKIYSKLHFAVTACVFMFVFCGLASASEDYVDEPKSSQESSFNSDLIRSFRNFWHFGKQNKIESKVENVENHASGVYESKANEEENNYKYEQNLIAFPIDFKISIGSGLANGKLQTMNYQNGSRTRATYPDSFLISNLPIINGALDIKVADRINFRFSGDKSYSRGGRKVSSFEHGFGAPTESNPDAVNYGTINYASVASAVSGSDFKASFDLLPEFKIQAGYRRSANYWDNKTSYFYENGSIDSDGSFIPNGSRDSVLNYRQKYQAIFKTPYVGVEFKKLFFKNRILISLNGAYSNQVKAEERYSVQAIFDQAFASESSSVKFKKGRYFNFGSCAEIMFKDFSVGLGYSYDNFYVKSDSPVENDHFSDFALENEKQRRIKMHNHQFSLLVSYKFQIPFIFNLDKI